MPGSDHAPVFLCDVGNHSARDSCLCLGRETGNAAGWSFGLINHHSCVVLDVVGEEGHESGDCGYNRGRYKACLMPLMPEKIINAGLNFTEGIKTE